MQLNHDDLDHTALYIDGTYNIQHDDMLKQRVPHFHSGGHNYPHLYHPQNLKKWHTY